MKPGQFYTYEGILYRLKKRTAGCKGCYFEDAPLMCPGVVVKGVQKMNCVLHKVVLTKV